MIQIDHASANDYDEMIAVWEDAVRATHHFLEEEQIQYYKPLIKNEYFQHVDLRCARDESGAIKGFVGVAGNKLEMLFVHSDSHGKGLGKQLLTYSVEEMGVTEVDVNEQNEGATGFYKHCGFEVVERSAVDGQGNPFPILHMKKIS
ncbi:putative acetyltransferase [Chitinophaga dinghuensis]|uniref:Putative acetyltransferase n=1 Tax=Chitinophaga dinghuensis TaxID=1539050 RepID=A0A327VJT1_9BACT|nr:GNAT family N-acetyltransferase [Chitinophaga dinghuensis]RAJ74970.1 putative acetyltransferase [Chitinophaga dinghuensis]